MKTTVILDKIKTLNARKDCVPARRRAKDVKQIAKLATSLVEDCELMIKALKNHCTCYDDSVSMGEQITCRACQCIYELDLGDTYWERQKQWIP